MPPTPFPSPSLPLPGDACCLRLSGFPPLPCSGLSWAAANLPRGHLPLCASPGRSVLSIPKLWVGFFIFWLCKFGLFVLCFCIVVQYCVFFYSGILRSEGHFWRPKVLYVLSMCCVCIVPMVSHVIHVHASLCW
jgi:hypothetical protein